MPGAMKVASPFTLLVINHIHLLLVSSCLVRNAFNT